MFEIVKWNGNKDLLARAPMVTGEGLTKPMQDVLNAVKAEGDKALTRYTAQFDKVEIFDFKVSEEELRAAYEALSDEMKASLNAAKANIEAFHTAQRPQSVNLQTMPGVTCELQWRAIDRVGLYVPGGSAPLFSTVLMLALPAMLAGCQKIILCAPPQKDGKMNKETMAAAYLCGLREVYKVGGAQAIAAMAYGTKQIPKVDKIFGPGNAYVTKAKQLVSEDPEGAAIDMPAGPSEVMVLADNTARPDWVAADLLAQAEHDEAAQAMLVTTDEVFAEKVREELLKQMAVLPRRVIIEKSLAQSRAIIAKNEEEAYQIVNDYAPEHLILQVKDAEAKVELIRNAGSVFVGALTPETAGDYASGTNHVLPTYGFARAYSGLSLYSFLRRMTVQNLTSEGFNALAPVLEAMARSEGLDAHAAAVSIRR